MVRRVIGPQTPNEFLAYNLPSVAAVKIVSALAYTGGQTEETGGMGRPMKPATTTSTTTDRHPPWASQASPDQYRQR